MSLDDSPLPLPTSTPNGDVTARQFMTGMFVIAAVAITLRFLFPLADPPWHAPVGIVWHDEGAWTHNARNHALFGVWKLDAWNPVYLAPVFTGLEFVSFRFLGVGLWQARLVSELAGLLAVLLMAFAVRRAAGRAAGLAAGALMATNYVWVMWNRAALMEATMVTFMVAAFWAYERARAQPAWGVLAGALAVVAFLTKAAAAFFVAALALEAVLNASQGVASAWNTGRDGDRRRQLASACVFAGLLAATLVAVVTFVAPNWSEYRFYNWEMSVTRKPEYSLKALLDRTAWVPIVHDFFTRMWSLHLLALAAAAGVLVRWKHARPSERLLVLWIALGMLELILHDVGNERRLVFLIPPMAGLAAMTVGYHRRFLSEEVGRLPVWRAVAAGPLLLYGCYLAVGPVVRLASLYDTRTGVRFSALVAASAAALVVVTWPRIPRWLSRDRWQAGASVALVCVIVAGDLAQYGQWAVNRSSVNYQAMVELGRWLPPGTLVHGKLANGLSLENRIWPVFVGRGFGNYADRRTRDDVHFILTYLRPYVGYEGRVIRDVLDSYNWRTVRTFRVAETTSGQDVAALIEKVSPRGR